MKYGWKALTLALTVVLLCVPAAMAKSGNGHGKPSWAGHGNSHAKVKPAKVKHEKKAKPAKAAHEKRAKKEKQQAGVFEADAEASEDEELSLEDLNPSWFCKTLEAMLDEADADAVEGGAEPGEFSSFDSEFGTNANKRNSHGQCTSRRAHGKDLSGVLPANGAEEEEQCEESVPEETDGEASGSEDGAENGEEASPEEGPEESEAEAALDDCEAEDPSAEPAGEEEGGNDAEEGEDGEQAAFARALVTFIRL
jgi:hypothetical protein